MNRALCRPELVDLYQMIDEIEALHESSDANALDSVIADAIAPVLAMLREERPRADFVPSPLEILVRLGLW